jgi:autotransporter-associated beta strand protein
VLAFNRSDDYGGVFNKQIINFGSDTTGGISLAAGNLTLTSSLNSYTGGTSITGGTLIINGNNTAATGAVAVASGATLGGTGTIGGATTVNGSLSPGDNGPGVLKLASSLTLTSTAATLMDLNSSVRGSGYDGIDVTGAMVYSGSLSLNFGSSFLSNGATFNLFNVTGVKTSGLTAVNFSGAYGSGSFTANGTGEWINTSNGADWAFSETTGVLTINAVPEPGTWALLAISLVSLLLFRVRPGTSPKRVARASRMPQITGT